MVLIIEAATFEDAGEGPYTLSVTGGEPGAPGSSAPGGSAPPTTG
jgi:hypothetical protein